jgi:hypothetical protein
MMPTTGDPVVNLLLWILVVVLIAWIIVTVVRKL